MFVFLSTILFVGIFFAITIFDLQSRDALNEEQETFFRVEYGDPPMPLKVGVGDEEGPAQGREEGHTEESPVDHNKPAEPL